MLKDKVKKNPFQVPENYFDNFNSEIMNMLPEKTINKSKVIPLWATIGKWSGVAALITGIALFGLNYIKSGTYPAENATAYDIQSSEEIDYYQFIEDEATQLAYKDALFNEDSF